MAPLIYLASPYYHEHPQVRERRYKIACKVTGLMLRRGLVVYSPIVHNHPIAELIDLPKDWTFWEKIDITVLARCDMLYVLTIDDGWERSVGVRAEIKFATGHNIPITHTKLEDWEDWQ